MRRHVTRGEERNREGEMAKKKEGGGRNRGENVGRREKMKCWEEGEMEEGVISYSCTLTCVMAEGGGEFDVDDDPNPLGLHWSDLTGKAFNLLDLPTRDLQGPYVIKPLFLGLRNVIKVYYTPCKTFEISILLKEYVTGFFMSWGQYFLKSKLGAFFIHNMVLELQKDMK